MSHIIAVYVLLTLDLVIREVFLRRGKEAKTWKRSAYDKGTTLMAAVLIIVAYILPFLLNYLNLGSFKDNFQIAIWFGVVLMLLGIWVEFLSIKTLGKFFSRTLLIQKDQRIVKDGLYRKIRHPGYLGGLIIWFGFGLGSGNWFVLITIMILMSFYYVYRIHYEEKMLIENFGDDYRDYRRKTWKLIPSLY